MIKNFLSYSSKTKRRDFASWAIYVILNIALAISIAVALVVFSSIWLAIGLLVLSKWRVFAVKPRFWWANIQSNAVDFIVGLGFIIYLAQVPLGSYISQITVILVYIFWLLVVKPRSSRPWVVAQGLTALYLGSSLLLISGPDWPSVLMLVLLTLVCFITERHILAVHDIENVNYYAALAAMIGGETMWVLSHWVVAYNLPLRGLCLVQPALIVVLLMMVVELITNSILSESDEVKDKLDVGWLKEVRPILLPIILSLVTVLVLLTFFARPLIGSI